MKSIVEQIKEIHAKGGRQLTKEEIVEFIKHPIYLGLPTPILGGKRGPKPKRTKYDLAEVVVTTERTVYELPDSLETAEHAPEKISDASEKFTLHETNFGHQ